MMLKRIIGVPAIALLSMAQAFGQLYTGTTGMYIKSGTTFITDSLVLIPSADLNLNNITISRSDTAVQGISGSSIQQVYNLSAPLTFQGAAGIYYNTAQLNGNAAAALALAYNNVVSGSWVTTSGTSVNTGTNYLSQTFATPVQLAGITATTFGVILPVTLVDFTARAEANKVRLDWEMNATDKITFCEVQHAADGKHFRKLEQLSIIAGNHKYNLYDTQPLPGINFYRLRWKDETGAEKFSSIRSVLFSNSRQQELTLYPLPVKDLLHIDLSDNRGNGSYVSLSAIDGKVIMRKDFSTKKMILDLQSYPPGMYILTYYDGVSARNYKVDKH
jgi:hypothetical protein